jgi:hypothetical protein
VNRRACAQRETLPIAGYALDGTKFDGIYVGRLRGKDLVYAGKVDHGFDSASAKDLQARLCTKNLKSDYSGDRNFSAPLVRPTLGDVRDHIDSRKSEQ